MAASLALALTCASTRADISSPLASPPPQADAISARVERGGETTIELRGHYGQSGAASFWIVSPPEHGKLSALRSTGDNVASVTYQHDGNRDFPTDGFSYIIQAGGRVSAAAEVKIAIDEPPPRLRVPASLDFGEIKAGEITQRSLTIANEGGGNLQGRLTTSNPWTIVQTDYGVGSGEEESIVVTFQPNEPRDFVGQLTLTPATGPPTIVALSGRATAPLRIAPNPLSMGAERRATVFLTNLTDHEMILNFKTGENLKPIASLDLPPKQDGDITVEVLPEVKSTIHDSITIVGVHFTLELPVDAAAPEKKAVAKNPVASLSNAVSPPARSSPIAATPAAENAAAHDQAPALPTAEAPAFPNAAPKITAERLGSSRWKLRWPAGKISAASYRVEERDLALVNKELQISWREVTAAKIDAKRNPVSAQIDRLDPRALHILRVSALDADGKVLWQSPLVSLAPEPQESHERFYLLWLFGAVLFALAYFRWRSTRGVA
ncbi:MAG TPA: hypothetical protein VGG02_07765 [Chthoniobacterales bacterium]|jgi:hypothetical protein